MWWTFHPLCQIGPILGPWLRFSYLPGEGYLSLSPARSLWTTGGTAYTQVYTTGFDPLLLLELCW